MRLLVRILENRHTVMTSLFFTVVSLTLLNQIQQMDLRRSLKKKSLKKEVIKYNYDPNNIRCHKVAETVLRMADEKFKPSSNKNIYFVETSCKGGLNSRQACSVETAARAHPNRRVIVLVTGPLSKQFMKGYLFTKMTTKFNIEFVRINVAEFSKGTPLENLFKKEIFKGSRWPVVHSSDALRILTLYKYGGLYIDLDMIVLKSFDTLPANFLVYTNNFILAISDDEVGKYISETLLRELARSYRPTVEYDYSGPKLMRRVLDKMCANNGSKIVNGTCRGFTIINMEQFQLLSSSSEWHKYMSDWKPNKPLDYLYTHHLCNQMGYKAKVPKNCYYVKLAKQYCPLVYDVYGNNFGS